MRLTARQQQIADLIIDGLTDKEIGRELGIAYGTVRSHVATMLRATGHERRIAFAAEWAAHKTIQKCGGVLDLSKKFGVPVC